MNTTSAKLWLARGTSGLAGVAWRTDALGQTAYLYIGTGAGMNLRLLIDYLGAVYPSLDASADCGKSDHRWRTVYASGGNAAMPGLAVGADTAWMTQFVDNDLTMVRWNL